MTKYRCRFYTVPAGHTESGHQRYGLIEVHDTLDLPAEDDPYKLNPPDDDPVGDAYWTDEWKDEDIQKLLAQARAVIKCDILGEVDTGELREIFVPVRLWTPRVKTLIILCCVAFLTYKYFI